MKNQQDLLLCRPYRPRHRTNNNDYCLFKGLLYDNWLFLPAILRGTFQRPPRPVINKVFLSGPPNVQLNGPDGFAMDENFNLYAASHSDHTVYVYDPNGQNLGKIVVDAPRVSNY